MNPCHIFVGGQELLGWTEMTLQRAKKDLTGSLSVSLFFTYLPDSPVAISATKNKDITVYIGGHLAFTGKVDARKGSGTKGGGKGSTNNEKSGGGRSVSIGADEYTVKITARGKTKTLIDSSHQHPTTNMLKPTNREVIEKLIQPWGVQIDWKASPIKLDKVRFRDGAKVFDEISRIATENGHFLYETRDGKLRITDDTGREEGEPLILGQNVMTFSAEQSESDAKSKVKVKGQRTDKNIRGEQAVLKIEKEIKDAWVEADNPFILQHYGDATPEALERRANFETNKRSSESKKLTIGVFHIQSSNGAPWDIGKLHYCEIPPEGIFDVFECTELTYTVQNDKTIKTVMTLSPPPSSTGAASASSGVPSGIANLVGGVIGLVSSVASLASSRRRAAGITFAAGQYPAPWSGPDVSIVLPVSQPDAGPSERVLLADLAPDGAGPALTLPQDFQGGGA